MWSIAWVGVSIAPVPVPVQVRQVSELGVGVVAIVLTEVTVIGCDLREGLGIVAGIVQTQSQSVSGIVVDSWINKIDCVWGGDRA